MTDKSAKLSFSFLVLMLAWLLPTNLLPAQTPQTAKSSNPSYDLDGYWLGTLDTGRGKLRLQFQITTTFGGSTASLSSLDQAPGSIPMTFSRDGDKVRMEATSLGAVFSGTVNQEKKAIAGTFSQGGAVFPLTVEKILISAADVPTPRPQNPLRPLPYRSEDLTYENKGAGVVLAATLTIPEGKGPFPAVVLITGSGAQDRDEALAGHRPFLVLSDYLTRHGIAVLRADDRGTAKSTGSFAGATTADFATDTEAGVAFLKSRKEIDPHKIGLVGHSEGGIIAPLVASRNPDVAFIVMMAGSGVSGDEILIAQSQLIAEASGVGQAELEKIGTRQRAVMALARRERDPAAFERGLREILGGQIPEDQMATAVKQMTSPWIRYFIEYDPAPALRKVKCPVLALNGSKDLQVPPKQNLPAIRKALEAGGNTHFEVVEMPGLNHLFQTAKTGSPSEYFQIEETIAPAALEKIAGWIVKQ